MQTNGEGRVLIAGCGYVGVALGKRLCGAGFRVTGLRRNTAQLPAEIEPFAADLLDRRALSRLEGPWDFVVYAAGASQRSVAAYREAYVAGLERLIDTIGRRGRGPGRFIFVSSTGVYGQNDGSWVDEDTPVVPPVGPLECLIEGEGIAARAPFPAVVVRFGGIYGPGRCSLLRRIRAGEIAQTESGAYTNRIHREDCAGVIHHLMRLEAPAGLYHAVDDEPVERGRLISWLASEMEARLAARSETGQPSGSGYGKRCRNARLRASGYEFRYPSFREGYGEMLKDPTQW